MLSYSLRNIVLAVLLVFSTVFPGCSGNQQPQTSNTPANANTATKRPASGPPLYEGYLDIADCDMIHGWAWNQNDPDGEISVEIYDGATLLATVKADEHRPDLVTAGKGTGNYAYTYLPPASVKDGKPHSIRVRVAGVDFDLGNSPKTITCSTP